MGKTKVLSPEDLEQQQAIFKTTPDVNVLKRAEYVEPVSAPEGNGPEWGKLLKGHWEQNNIIGAANFTKESREDLNVDFNFKPYDAIKEVKDVDLTPENHEYLSTSHGQEQYDLRLGEIRKTNEFNKTCAESGIVPTLLTGVPVGMADPLILFAGFAEAKILAQSLRAGVAFAGLTGVAQERVLDSVLHNRTATDYIIAGTSGLALGGVGAGLTKTFSKAKPAKSGLDTAIDKQFKQAKGIIIKAGAGAKDAVASKVPFAGAMNKAFDDATASVNAFYKNSRIAEALSSAGSVGAATKGRIKKRGETFMAPYLEKFGSDYEVMKGKGVKSLTDFNEKHFSWAAGDGGQTVRKDSTALLTKKVSNQLKTRGPKQIEVLKNRYGNPSVFDENLKYELNARKKGEYFTEDPTILEAADLWEHYNKFENKLGTQAGSTRHVDSDINSTYYKQTWKTDVIHNQMRLGRRDSMQVGIQNAILKMGKNIIPNSKDKSIAYKMAGAIIDRSLAKATGKNTGAVSIMDNAKEWMGDVLRKHGMEDADVESTMKILAPDDFKVINLDFDTPIPNSQLRVGDLLDGSSTAQLNATATEAAGDIALARNGITNDKQWGEEVESIVAEVGLRHGSKAGLQVRNILDAQHRAIKGQSTEVDPQSAIAVAMRRARDAFALLSLNQMLFPQLSELGRIMGSVGLRNFVESAPALKNFVYKVRNMDGTARGELIANMEESGLTVGGFHLLDAKNYRTGEIVGGSNTSSWGDRFDRFTANMRKKQSKWTGMDGAMDSMHQLAVTSISNKLYKLSQSGKAPDEAFRKRLRDMTIGDEDFKKIMKNMKNGVTDPNSKSGCARTLNMQDWDVDVRERYFTAITQYTHDMIQMDMAGESMWWLGNSLGKTVFQFKKFPMIAFEKQLIHDLKFNDAQTYKTAAYALAMSTAMYHAKTYLNAAGRLDYDEYVEKRLTGRALVTGSIKYAGQLSLLPEVVQVLAGVTGVGEMTDTRDALAIAPSFQMGYKVAKALPAIPKLLLPSDDEGMFDMTTQDAQNLGAITGVTNLAQTKIFFNILASGAEKMF